MTECTRSGKDQSNVDLVHFTCDHRSMHGDSEERLRGVGGSLKSCGPE